MTLCADQVRPRTARRGFSLIELVMVLSTMAFISAIAVPRLTSASDRSRESALTASTRNLMFAMELYAAEHFDRPPTENADGSLVSDPNIVINRLTKPTNDQGTVMAGGEYGPYLKVWPTNPVNGKKTLRFGPAAAGTHGWYLPSGGRQIRPDKGVANLTAGGGEMVAAEEGP